MSIQAEQIETTCEAVAQNLADFGAEGAQLDSLLDALAALRWLREQYADSKDAFAPLLGRLGELKQQAAEAMRAAREALTREYLQAGSAADAWRARREACRDALAELAQQDKIDVFQCAEGAVTVTPYRAMSLPPAGSAQRDEIVQIVTEAGRWPDASVLNPRKLIEAVEAGLFSPEHAGRITAICRPREKCRLSAKRSHGG